MNKTDLIHIFVFFCVVFINYIIFIPLGPWLHWADPMIYVNSSENMLRGYSYLFPVGHHYGGMVLTWFRTLWILLFTPFQISHEFLHYFFSFIICPFLLSVFTYFASKVYFSNKTSFILGLTIAVGFKGLDIYLGLDYFIGAILLSQLLIIVRAQSAFPLLDLTPKRLFLFSFISGLSIYNWKASFLTVFALFFPWELILQESKSFIKNNQKSPLLKFLFILLCVFLFITIYLSIFRGSLGTFFGREVKIYHLSFLLYSFILMILFYAVLLKDFIKKNRTLLLKRSLYFLIFLWVGYLPQFYYNLVTPIHENTRFIFWASTAESLEFFAKMPNALLSFFTGADNNFMFYHGVERHIILIFMILGFILSFFKFKNKAGYVSFYFLFLLNALAFILIYNTSVAEYRYFFPSFQVFLMFYACFWERVSRNKKLLYFSYFFLLLSFWHQWNHKKSMIDENIKSKRVEEIRNTFSDFKNSSYAFVVSTQIDFHEIFNLIGNREPRFLYGRDILVHTQKYQKDDFTAPAGFGLIAFSEEEKNLFIKELSQKFSLQFEVQFIKKNGKLNLYKVISL